MNGQEHYEDAEGLLSRIARNTPYSERVALIAQAQAHATLSVADFTRDASVRAANAGRMSA